MLLGDAFRRDSRFAVVQVPRALPRVWRFPADVAEGADKPHPVRTYRLEPGDAGIFDVGALHSIDYCDGASFARVTGADIDDAPVRIFKDVDVRAEIAAQLGD